MKKRISLITLSFSLFLLLLIIGWLLMGVESSSSAGATQIYFADNISVAHMKMIDRFNEKYRGQIEVVPIDLPFSKFSTNERKELLARSLRSKSDLIDIFAVDVIWVPRFAKWGYPLDSNFQDISGRNFLSNAIQSCYYGGKLVAAPLYTDIGLLYYRRDILQQLPDFDEIEKQLKESITWEEFIGLSQRLNYSSGDYFLFPANNYEGLICVFVELLASQGENFVEGDSLRLDTPAARKSLKLLTDLVHRYHLTPAVVSTYDEYKSYIYTLENDAVFLRGWPGFLLHYRDLIEDTTKFSKFGIGAIPHFTGGKPASVFGGWNLMISKHSENKWAAVKFIEFTLSEESQKLMYENGGYIPVNLKVYRDSEFMETHPRLVFYRKLLEYGVHRPYMENYTKISDIISYYVHLAIKNEIPPEIALQNATRSINADKIVIR